MFLSIICDMNHPVNQSCNCSIIINFVFHKHLYGIYNYRYLATYFIHVFLCATMQPNISACHCILENQPIYHTGTLHFVTPTI